MKPSGAVHWLAVGCLAYYTLRHVVVTGVSPFYVRVGAIGLWSFLTWMLFRRPRQWGLGIGLFLLVVIAIQIGLTLVALAGPQGKELSASHSWMTFGVGVLPLLIGGVSSISLRRLLDRDDKAAARRH